jgi:hypothetical protein
MTKIVNNVLECVFLVICTVFTLPNRKHKSIANMNKLSTMRLIITNFTEST